MGTSAGPDDTSTVTVSPWWYAEPAAGCCPTIVPCAAVLLEVCGVSRFTPCALAHCSAACTFIPKKLGSGGLAATRIATGFVCGHVVPATGLVPSTVPTGAVEPTFCSLLIRCARASAACACASVSFFTTGTMEVNGPAETRSETADPFAARPAGLAPTTEPSGNTLLCTGVCPRTVKPLAFRAAVAVATESPLTEGTCAYRPVVSHQPPTPSPTPSTRISAIKASRGLNSQRCKNGSRLPGYLPSSPRRTTSVCEAAPSPPPPFPHCPPPHRPAPNRPAPHPP